MVIAQPHVPDTSLSPTEPFQFTQQAKAQELAVLTRTLEVACVARHGVPKAHFTIFPEYSIPGLDGVALVETALHANGWPNGTIVIGGTDALEKAEYVELLQGNATYVDMCRNGAELVPPDQWVNCAITWVKGGDGSLQRWIQPKLHPAWKELNISHEHMFRGGSVYLFEGLLENGSVYRFGTLVCFDWIATVGIQSPRQWILADLHQRAAGNKFPLTWLFIIQRNPKPSDDTFMNGAGAFFNQTEFPNALREHACLVFANTAGRAEPGHTDKFGGCSVVLSPQSLFDEPRCAPTFSTGGPRFRDGSNLLHSYRLKDIFFRERGACIHSFAQINPGSIPPGPAGRTIAVQEAYVFPISGILEPRAPALDVPASIKLLNDELDGIPSLARSYGTAPLAPQIDNVHLLNIAALRGISSQSAERAVRLASAESKEGIREDEWDVTESDALAHCVHTLDIVGIGFPPPNVGSVPPHASVLIHNSTVDVLAIRGSSHERCIEHSKRFLTNPQRQVLLVSRDADNTFWQRRFGSFLQPAPPRPGQERDITDPASGSLHLGYHNLLGIFRRAATVAEIEGGISAELAA
jgi:hypothetical protein